MGLDWPTPPKLAVDSAKNRERGKLQTLYEELKTFADCLTGQTKCGIILFTFQSEREVLLTQRRLSKQFPEPQGLPKIYYLY
jgi:hypothetical protein